MRPIQKSQVKISAKALIDDLSAVRAAVLYRQPAMTGEERVRFEARLFESWVIDRLAQQECQVLALDDELAELRDELAALRKSLSPPAKKLAKEKKRS